MYFTEVLKSIPTNPILFGELSLLFFVVPEVWSVPSFGGQVGQKNRGDGSN